MVPEAASHHRPQISVSLDRLGIVCRGFDMLLFQVRREAQAAFLSLQSDLVTQREMKQSQLRSAEAKEL